MVIPFFAAKMIDFDSAIGFDREFLLVNGKAQTFEYLSNSNSEWKSEIYKHIGDSVENCRYQEEDLNEWLALKLQYFQDYILPVE